MRSPTAIGALMFNVCFALFSPNRHLPNLTFLGNNFEEKKKKICFDKVAITAPRPCNFRKNREPKVLLEKIAASMK